jgi:hypothetical protein
MQFFVIAFTKKTVISEHTLLESLLDNAVLIVAIGKRPELRGTGLLHTCDNPILRETQTDDRNSCGNLMGVNQNNSTTMHRGKHRSSRS